MKNKCHDNTHTQQPTTPICFEGFSRRKSMYKVNTWLHMVYDFIIFSSSRNKLDKVFGEFIAKLVRATLYFNVEKSIKCH